MSFHQVQQCHQTGYNVSQFSSSGNGQITANGSAKLLTDACPLEITRNTSFGKKEIARMGMNQMKAGAQKQDNDIASSYFQNMYGGSTVQTKQNQ